VGKQQEPPEAQLNLLPASAGSLLGLLFNPKVEDTVFLQNIGLSPNYRVTIQKTILFNMPITVANQSKE
jgi:hypothetical protein